ncbi:MAG: glycosyltransferase family 4 protein [Spirochaetota bacterium]
MAELQPRILVWHSFPLKAGGGPSGYLYIYYMFLQSRGLGASADFLADICDISGLFKESRGMIQGGVDKLADAFGRIHERTQAGHAARQSYRRAKRKFRSDWSLHPDVSTYDIIHFHSSWELVKSSAILRGFHGKIILSSHSPLPWHMEYLDSLSAKGRNDAISPRLERLLEAIDREAFERADFVMSPCQSAMDGYGRHWGIFDTLMAGKATIHIPTAIAMRQASPLADFRKSLGLEENAQLFLFGGRHNEAKGYDLLVKAAEALFAASPRACVLVVGNEAPLHGPAHSRWIELGWRGDMAAIMASCDWLVLPNREAYFDLVLLEAMAAGLPAVVSAVGGNLHFSDLEGRGLLFHRPGEAASLAECLLAAASMEFGQLNSFKQNCRERVLSAHGFDQYQRSYQDALYKVFAKAGE